MSSSIAIVGAGPTAIYTLSAFLNATGKGATVTIYEEQRRAGLGTPYRPGWNDPAMLSNIASVEIPPICETLIAWLHRQPRARLVRLGIDPDTIDDHAFYPRVALGEYFLDQFNGLIEKARHKGITVEIAADSRIADIAAADDGLTLSVAARGGQATERRHDHVVLATGHQWPEEPEVRPGYFLSPWPATALQRIAAGPVGIRGSSLTAIDAVVAIALAHGRFIETGENDVVYRVDAGAEALRLTMMSRKGLLPEADFHHPLPYEPLAICTPEAVAGLIAAGSDGLLDRAFALFKAELAHVDPDYAAKTGLDGLGLDDFPDRYFADRMAADPFAWAEANLAEARADFEREHTVPWRYAILRMHEVIAPIVPHLDEEDFDRFNRLLKPIFVDEYATVPHLSLRRLLALHAAGCLEVLAIGERNHIDTRGGSTGATLSFAGQRRHFPAFVDATGQRALKAEDFPFPSLIDQGVVHDTADDDAAGSKGIAVDDRFHPVTDHSAGARLFCLSIPFLLERHPFIQGITSSHEMGEIVGAELAGAMA